MLLLTLASFYFETIFFSLWLINWDCFCGAHARLFVSSIMHPFGKCFEEVWRDFSCAFTSCIICLFVFQVRVGAAHRTSSGVQAN